MAKRSLKDLKTELVKQESSSNSNYSDGFYPIWKLPFDGITKLRILEDPDQDNPLIVYREYLEHSFKVDDKWIRFPCLKNNGKNVPCPVCELSAKLYNADNKKMGKVYYRDAMALVRAIITKDGMEYAEDDDTAKGTVRPFKFSYQLFQKLKSELAKLDDDEVPWDLDEGLDFIIEKQRKQVEDKEYGNYETGSGFARKTTEISDDWREGITDEPLSALVGEIPTYDEAHKLLQKHLAELHGSGGDDDDDDDATESEDELMEKLSRNKSDKKKKKDKKKNKKVVEDDDDDDDDNALAVLADSDDDDDDDILALLGDDDDD